MFWILNITNALQTEDVVIIENNLHEENSYRFILSYCNKFRAKSICRFFYLDDVNELIRRVKNRVKHLGHAVSDETVYKRYKSSIELIVENINSFDEIHFYDVSKENAEAVKVFEVFDGELNYINENVSFKWSDVIIDQLIDN